MFIDEVIARIENTVAAWRGDQPAVNPEPFEAQTYSDIPSFYRSVKLAEIVQHGHVLTPGRYVGAEEVEEVVDSDEGFATKMQQPTEKLGGLGVIHLNGSFTAWADRLGNQHCKVSLIDSSLQENTANGHLRVHTLLHDRTHPH